MTESQLEALALNIVKTLEERITADVREKLLEEFAASIALEIMFERLNTADFLFETVAETFELDTSGREQLTSKINKIVFTKKSIAKDITERLNAETDRLQKEMEKKFPKNL
jgi:hypothetical protein